MDQLPAEGQTVETLRAFEGLSIQSAVPGAKEVGAIPSSLLLKFGEGIVNLRRGRLDSTASPPGTALHVAGNVVRDRSKTDFQQNATIDFHNAIVALNVFTNAFKVSPIGMQHLERLEMVPAGMQRGGLIATIPLAPKEKTSVTYKEWSVTSKEFTSIITESLENFSETGVTENTELAQATTSQTAHSNQFNINATLTGTYGPVTATVTTGFGSQDQDSQSASEGRKHAIATTRSASSRVKQEHKVTISTTTTVGSSDASTRILENVSATDAIRIDYYSLIRKWHVSLFRYKLRLTYDIAIPEPAATIRAIYAEMEALRLSLGQFSFGVVASAITKNNYISLGAQFLVVLAPPPEDPKEVSIKSTYTESGDTTFFGPPHVMAVEIPDGYVVKSATLFINLQSDVHISNISITRLANAALTELLSTNIVAVDFLVGKEGKQFILYATSGSPSGALEVDLELTASAQAMVVWQQQTWAVLFGAAQSKYFSGQQKIQAKLDLLVSQISNVNTLTLRREENEEIMKAALKWILGPTFSFMPDDVLQVFVDQQSPFGGVDITHGSAAFDTGMSVTQDNWSLMLRYQKMIKFINEAIEWENVLYFAYPYFWDIPFAWSFIRRLRHPDASREAFLRAGSARVILTVRRGWEEAWVNFVETGGFGETLLPGHPYLSIAREVEAYDLTNYPGVPPANPAGGPLPDDGTSVCTVSSDTLVASTTLVIVNVLSSEGFRVGYSGIIDTYSTGQTVGGLFTTFQESQVIMAVADGKITVQRLAHPHDGSVSPVALRQAGEAGHLMADWFEYTPTPGTDIAVTSNLATVV